MENEWHWSGLRSDQVPVWWPVDAALWRGWLRLIVLAYVVTSLFGFAGLGMASGNETLYGLGSLAAMIAIALMLLVVPIVLFNRPKFLVVPWMRHQPGAIAEWRGAEVPPTPPPGSGRRWRKSETS